ncbi:putative ZZ-type domain-containing protein [Seiridium cardinale]|uniref:ZZ-type domain-containing protein n=1 Tax=Seiridium cardinale TaxID=138064 RepID=A0ABR2YA42_9PEZI
MQLSRFRCIRTDILQDPAQLRLINKGRCWGPNHADDYGLGLGHTSTSLIGDEANERTPAAAQQKSFLEILNMSDKSSAASVDSSIDASPLVANIAAARIAETSTGDTVAGHTQWQGADLSQSIDLDEHKQSYSGDRLPEYGAEGLLTLRHPSNAPADSDEAPEFEFDIIVVHGLLGAQRPPWSNPGSGNSGWLDQQGAWNGSHITSFGYDVSKVLSGTLTRSTIRNIALDLLRGLLAERAKRTTALPIMFVAHDIGGIIVKDALTTAALNPKSFGDIFDFARVLLFYGCPHRAKDQLDMEERFSRFFYREDAARLPSTSRSTSHLAEAVLEINSRFFNSKHFFQSYILSIYSGNSEYDIDNVFDGFTGTMGVPFEVRIENCLANGSDGSKIEETLKRIKSQLGVDISGIDNVRSLISASSPLLPLATGPSLKSPFSWLTNDASYKSWYNQRRPQLLYLHSSVNVRGASEYIFYDLDKLHHNNNGQIVLYFTFNQHDIRRDTIQDMLATFLAQIIGHFPTITDTATGQFTQHRLQRSWNYNDLLYWFDCYRQIGEIEGISCVINHFDECDPASRKDFLDVFRHKSQTEERPWRLLITSRKPGILADELHEAGWPVLDLEKMAPSTNDAQPVMMTTNDTIKHALMARHPELRCYGELIDHEFRTIANLEPGVCQLIVDHVTSTNKWPMHQTIHDTFGPVEDLSLQTVLQKILTKVPDKPLVVYVLSWILYSVRPPTTWELEEAISFAVQPSPSGGLIPSRPKSIEDFLNSLAGIVSREEHDLLVVQSDIRDLLTMDISSKTGNIKRDHTDIDDTSMVFGYICDNLRRSAHKVIVRACLRCLQTEEAKEKLMALYATSEHRETHTEICCDRTSLYDYAIQFWLHHLKQAVMNQDDNFEEDVVFFIRSGNVESWLAALWALANPVTRSEQPYATIRPILVGAGLLELADTLGDGDEDTSAAMIEACLNGHVSVSMELLSRTSYSTESLEKALVAAGSYGAEFIWLRVIDHIKVNYPEFPWQDQGSQVARASWLGLCGVLKTLIEAKCPLEVPDPITKTFFPVSPLRYATRTNHVEAVRLLLESGADPRHRNDTGLTVLHLAAGLGNTEVINVLVDWKSDINSRAGDLTTPVYQACLWGNFGAAELLLSRGADPNISDRYDQDEPGWSPLIVAIQESHVECARTMIKGGADPNTVGLSGTALVYTILYQSFDTCKLLVEQGANVNHPRDKYSPLKTALLLGSSDRRLEIVRLLVENDAKVNEDEANNSNPLILASWLDAPDNLAVVDLLLSHGADVNCENEDGLRPISIAVTKADIALLRRLLEDQKIDFNSCKKGMSTPLMMANDNAEITRILLESGADPNYTPEGQGPPIMAAVMADNAEVVNLLIKYGAAIDPPVELMDEARWEPMEYAVVCGKPDMIRILGDGGADVNRRWGNLRTLVHKAMQGDGLRTLLEFRPDINVQAEEGNAPLHEIYPNTPEENVRLLIRAGADINAVDKDDTTPLANAIRNGHGPAARFLMSRKPHVNIASPDWGGPLHLACNRGMFEIAQDLIDAGANVNQRVSGTPGTPLISVFVGYGGRTCEDDEVKARVIDLLLASGADITETSGMLANVIAAVALKGSPYMLRLMLSRGGQAGVRDIMGRLPLHLAALRGDLECVNVLLEAGEDVGMPDKVGRNALHWAVQGGDLEVVERMLTKLGKDSINQPDKDGWTPLCWAARGCGAAMDIRIVDEEDQYEFLKKLLEKGARLEDVSIIPDRPWTPLVIAKHHRRTSNILDLLTSDVQATGNNQEGLPEALGKHELTEHNSYCDYCLYSIFGVNYECTTCNDFALCYKCYNSRGVLHNPDHEFKEIGPEFNFEAPSEHSWPPYGVESSASESASEPSSYFASEPDDVMKDDENRACGEVIGVD